MARKRRVAASSASGEEAAAETRKAEGLSPDAPAERQYFLLKSEPNDFSIDDLEALPNSTGPWDGVRNPQARNIMKGMRLGDLAFFYQSNCKVPGCLGIVEVVKVAYPDPSALDRSSKYYDPKATKEDPRWFMVDVQLQRRFKRLISLEELKVHREGALDGITLFRNTRLSVQRVQAPHWEFITSLEDLEPPPAPAPKRRKPREGRGDGGGGRGGTKRVRKARDVDSGSEGSEGEAEGL